MDEKENQKMFYSIGDVAKMFNVKTSLIRYWEKEFPTYIKPKKNRKGNRLFSQKDIENIRLIYYLVKEKGLTLQGAKKKLKENKDDTEYTMQIVQSLQNIKKLLQEVKDNL